MVGDGCCGKEERGSWRGYLLANSISQIPRQPEPFGARPLKRLPAHLEAENVTAADIRPTRRCVAPTAQFGECERLTRKWRLAVLVRWLDSLQLLNEASNGADDLGCSLSKEGS